MTAHTKNHASTVDALRDEYRQIHRRIIALAGRCKPDDPRLAKLRKIEQGVIDELAALGAQPDHGGNA